MTTPHSALQREQQELMRLAARDFVEEHFTLERRLEMGRAGSDEAAPETWRSLADMQWTGILVPETHGGGGSLQSRYHYPGSPDVHQQRIGEFLAAETA